MQYDKGNVMGNVMGLCAVVIINRVYQVRGNFWEKWVGVVNQNLSAPRVEVKLSTSVNHFVRDQTEQC